MEQRGFLSRLESPPVAWVRKVRGAFRIRDGEDRLPTWERPVLAEPSCWRLETQSTPLEIEIRERTMHEICQTSAGRKIESYEEIEGSGKAPAPLPVSA